MPIHYSVSSDGHFIHAVASVPLSNQDFINYEIDHAIDVRLNSPVSELFEIHINALQNITPKDIETIIERRKTLSKPHTQHRCGIVVTLGDSYSWDIAKFYEGMYTLHFPESVIVFGDTHTAKLWLGIHDNISFNRIPN